MGERTIKWEKGRLIIRKEEVELTLGNPETRRLNEEPS